MTDILAFDEYVLMWLALALAVVAFLVGLHAAFGTKLPSMNIQTSKEELYPYGTPGWLAWDEDSYKDANSPIGRGDTEYEAIHNLLEQINGPVRS